MQRTMFVIEDEIHAELQTGRYATFEAAFEEIQRRSHLAWDDAPNKAPCRSWQTCGRIYTIVQYDESMTPWEEVQRQVILEVHADGMTWHTGVSI